MNKKELNVRREIAKFTLRNVSEKLSDSKLKSIIGGYDYLGSGCGNPMCVLGVSCRGGQCFCDFEINGVIICEQPCGMDFCERFGPFNC